MSTTLTPLLLLSLLAAPPVPQSEPQPATLEGIVVDSVTGRGLAGAAVVIGSGAFGRALPTEDYDIGPLPGPGEQTTLRPRAASLQTSLRPVAVPNAGEPTAESAPEATSSNEAGPSALASEPWWHATVTDSAGRFRFEDVAPGSYRLRAQADGYVPREPGQEAYEAPGLTLVLNAGVNTADTIRLERTALIGGRIETPGNNSSTTALVWLLRRRYDAYGDPYFEPVAESPISEEGYYAFADLRPGRYYVVTGPDSRRQSNPTFTPYPMTYYPGVRQRELAGAIDVAAGTRFGALDFPADAGELPRISGHIVDTRTGLAPDLVELRFDCQLPARVRCLGRRAELENGQFELAGLQEGIYRLEVAFGEEDGFGGFVLGEDFFTVELGDTDIDDLVLSVPALASVRGRVRLADGSTFPGTDAGSFEEIDIRLERTHSSQFPVRPQASTSASDARFEMRQVPPGPYRVLVSPLEAGYYVSDLRLNGMRVAAGAAANILPNIANELEIIVSPAGAELSGRVVDGDGRPRGATRGVMLPASRARGDLRYVEFVTDASGNFLIEGIAPGAYEVFSWDAAAPYDFFDPELMRRSQPDARRVSLGEGSRQAVILEVIPAR